MDKKDNPVNKRNLTLLLTWAVRCGDKCYNILFLTDGFLRCFVEGRMERKSMLLSVPSVQVKLKEVKSQFLLSFFVIIKFCLQAL